MLFYFVSRYLSVQVDILHYAPVGVVPQAIIPSRQGAGVERLLQDQAQLRLCKFNANLGYNMTS